MSRSLKDIPFEVPEEAQFPKTLREASKRMLEPSGQDRALSVEI